MNTKKKIVEQLSQQADVQVAENSAAVSLQVGHLDFSLSGHAILRDISFSLAACGINTLIGPSGAGKSTLLRCLNQLHDGWQGDIRISGCNVRRWPQGADALRRQIGLIAQKPAVFPCSIRKNIVFGLLRRERKHFTGEKIEMILRQAALWDEVKDRLDAPADTLSIGQQQRLCIARALALSPSLLLLDEPTASLDPHSKQVIESSLLQLAENMPVLCVTHDIEQAQRLGGQTIFICDGRIIEIAAAETLFTRPERLETREFLRWSTCDCG
ncbi:MAG: ATP-binding cassette domain-containing protein [Mariprofundaceae bacterium]